MTEMRDQRHGAELFDLFCDMADEYGVPLSITADQTLNKMVKAFCECVSGEASVSREWTEEERRVLDELMMKQDLSEHTVLRQGLRLYQLQCSGLLKRSVEIPKASPEQAEYLASLLTDPLSEIEARHNGCTEAWEHEWLAPGLALAHKDRATLLSLLREERARAAAMHAVVDEQAEDEGLWFQPTTITEDILQKALRRLHEAAEGKTAEQCARAVLD